MTTNSNNKIKEVIRFKRFADLWGVGFRFTSKEVCFELSERAAPRIRDEFENELYHDMGAIDFKRTEDKLVYSVSLD